MRGLQRVQAFQHANMSLQVIDVLYSLYAVRNFGSAMAGLQKTSDVTSLTRY